MDDLVKEIARLTEGKDRIQTGIPGLLLFRNEQLTEPFSGVYTPSICMIVQGAKRVTLGKESFIYDAQH